VLRAQQRFLFLAALLFAPISLAAPAVYTQGLLWKIERAGQAPSHIFGTIHSEDSRVLTLPKPVQTVFDAAKVYVMEAVLDANAMQTMLGAMMFSDGRTLQQVIPPATYQKAVADMAGYGMPEQALKMMKPWALAVTFSLPKPKTGMVLDLFLMQQATEQGKQTAGLESVEEQIGVLDKLSLQEQTIMLEDTLKHLPQLEQIFADLHAAYLARDLARLVRISDEMQAKGNRELGKKVMHQLVDVRNRRMVERMEAYFKQGNVFFAIGALHLPGEAGVLKLLAQKGYRVSAVY
jgi:hypothetical protein